MTNALINSDFAIWQHGLSISAEGYSASRWVNTLSGVGTQTVSRQSFAFGQTEVPHNPQFYVRLTAVGTGGADVTRLENRVEDVRTFAGRAVTVDFWARRFSGAGNLRVAINQHFGTGGSPSPGFTMPELTATLTTAWQRFAFKFLVPSITGTTLGTNENSSHIDVFLVTNHSAFMQTIEVDIAQVQLLEGSGPLMFQPRPQGDELDACQRYFRKSMPPDVPVGGGAGLNTGEFIFPATANGAVLQRSPTLRFGKSMRTVPTITLFNPTAAAASTQAYDNVAAASLTTTTAVNVSRDGFAVTAIGAAGTAIGNSIHVHWRAYAEL